jgi:hypothetical protein
MGSRGESAAPEAVEPGKVNKGKLRTVKSGANTTYAFFRETLYHYRVSYESALV